MCGILWYSVWYIVELCMVQYGTVCDTVHDTVAYSVVQWGWQGGTVSCTLQYNRAMWWQSIALIHTMINDDVFELMTW